jgi:FkbM family methyltransferase
MKATPLLTKLKRTLKKAFYGYCPGRRGCFPYFGAWVYFPPGSWSFASACDEGIYEWNNVQLLWTLMKPGTWMLDVGANIGLMALPILHNVPESKVLSFEPSPNSAPWLERTIAGSGYRNRWRLVAKVAGASPGQATFFVSPRQASYLDGVVDTNRVEGGSSVTVDATTLDAEWHALGNPEVSLLKIDVEGWEFQVLQGASELLNKQRPSILLEWNAVNLRATQVAPEAILEFANSANYSLFTVQEFLPIPDKVTLHLQMLRGENFLLQSKR